MNSIYTPAQQRLIDHIKNIDYDQPGEVTDPGDPRVFALTSLPEADRYDGPDAATWTAQAQALGWVVEKVVSPEIVVARKEYPAESMFAFGWYEAGDAGKRVFADGETRDAEMAALVVELVEFYGV